jgi:hypothetical protein
MVEDKSEAAAPKGSLCRRLFSNVGCAEVGQSEGDYRVVSANRSPARGEARQELRQRRGDGTTLIR